MRHNKTYLHHYVLQLPRSFRQSSLLTLLVNFYSSWCAICGLWPYYGPSTNHSVGNLIRMLNNIVKINQIGLISVWRPYWVWVKASDSAFHRNKGDWTYATFAYCYCRGFKWDFSAPSASSVFLLLCGLSSQSPISLPTWGSTPPWPEEGEFPMVVRWVRLSRGLAMVWLLCWSE